MKLVINTAHQRFGGAIQVALSFINECRFYQKNEYHVWVGPGVAKSLDRSAFPDNFHFQDFDFGVVNLQKSFQINQTLQKEEKRICPDVIISTSGPTYFHSQAKQLIGFNLPLYIYPESPHLNSLTLKQKIIFQLKKKLHFYFFKRDADAFVVQTDDVNKRVRKVLNTDKVFTVTNTSNGFYNDWKKYPKKLPAKKNETRRFLTISSYYNHKNLEIIPQVLKELKSRRVENVEFVLTLKKRDFQEKINCKENYSQILNVGPIKPEECPSLYNECDFLFLPTLAECFSASYPEAMTMEKPIVTTDLGFARSICGEAALYYEPMNASQAAEKIIQLLTDDQLAARLVEKGKKRLKKFDTPKDRARKYLELCKKLIDDQI